MNLWEHSARCSWPCPWRFSHSWSSRTLANKDKTSTATSRSGLTTRSRVRCIGKRASLPRCARRGHGWRAMRW